MDPEKAVMVADTVGAMAVDGVGTAAGIGGHAGMTAVDAGVEIAVRAGLAEEVPIQSITMWAVERPPIVCAGGDVFFVSASADRG